MNATTAREHAVRASEILNGIDRRDRKMAEMTPAEHLELVAAGGIGRFNAQQSFLLELATAHAVASLALAHTEEEPLPDDAQERFSS